MNKLLVYFLSPLISIVLIVIRIDPVVQFLKAHLANADYFLWGFLILGTIINYYFYILSPFKKYQKFTQKRWKVFEKYVDDMVDTYKPAGLLKFNIMKPTFRLFTNIEPIAIKPNSTRLRVWTYKFKTTWKHKSSNETKNLNITVNQGNCGTAFRHADGVHTIILNEPLKATNQFNFNADQIGKTSHLTMVSSCDITKEIYSEHDKQFKTIGVLNVDTTSKQIAEMLSDETNEKNFAESLQVVVGVYKDLF